jgi:hypothetical protein
MTKRILIAAAAALAVLTCKHDAMPPLDGLVAVGTWGGDNSGAIVTDTLAHIHIGCTYGDVPGRIHVDDDGAFDVTGSYLLRAYPIAVGPTMPARFTGTVAGTTLVVTVVVNDTIEHKNVTLGPAKMFFGKEPSMGPCPICRTPGSRDMSAH